MGVKRIIWRNFIAADIKIVVAKQIPQQNCRFEHPLVGLGVRISHKIMALCKSDRLLGFGKYSLTMGPSCL